MKGLRRRWAVLLTLCLITALCPTLAEEAAPQDGTALGIPEADWTGDAAPEAWGLEVYYLDLGRVDGILIRCEGETSFIDVGMRSDAPPAIKALKAIGIDHLDSYIATHGHADHVGGASRIIAAFNPEVIYMNRIETLASIMDSATPEEAQTVSDTRSVVLNVGDTFAIGSAQVKCLGPASIINCGMDSQRENYNSLILRMDYGGHSFLFTGDTMDKNLREANRQFPGELDIDIFKNPHHNGAHKQDVIDFIRPKITVICTNNENQPTQKYQGMLREAGSQVYITGSDHNGNVVVACNEGELCVRAGYALESIALEPVPDMYVEQTCAIKGSIAPADCARPNWVGWNSSDEGVVRVSDGKIMAVGAGEATVTAASYNGIMDSVKVRVYTALVELERTELKLAVGEKAKLRARVLPENAGVAGRWVSEDESVVRCSSKGELVGLAQGKTRVIARLSNGAEAACEVTVEGHLVSKISLDRRKATMAVGDTLTLKPAVKPSGIEGLVFEWASSDEKVLWVDNDGNVTAVGKGKAKIGVRVLGSDKIAVCTIKVR